MQDALAVINRPGPAISSTGQPTAPGDGTETNAQGVDPSLFFEEKRLHFRHPNVGIMQSHNIYLKAQALVMFRNFICMDEGA
jgi:hypothetical protein